MSDLRKFVGGALMACALLTSSVAAAQQPIEFKQQLIDINTRHLPNVVNEHGWVAGAHEVHSGYYWDAIALRPSSQFGGTTDPIIFGMDSAGNFTGFNAQNYAGLVGQIPGQSASTFSPCPSPSPALGIGRSETDLVVGYAPCAGSMKTNAFIWDASTNTSVPIVGLNTDDSALLDISPSGQFAAGFAGDLQYFYGEPLVYYSAGATPGQAYGSYEVVRAVRYDLVNQSLEQLTLNITGIPAGYTVVSTTAMGTNDNGAVVGYATIISGTTRNEVPVIWPNPQTGWVVPMQPSFAHGCRAKAINSAWQLVGSCFNRTNSRPTPEAFIWDVTRGARKLFDVTQNPSHSYVEATDINDMGQVTVGLQHPLDVDPGAALLTPLSIPYGACQVGGSCHMMYSNQCAGHQGSFAPNTYCAVVGPKEPVGLE